MMAIFAGILDWLRGQSKHRAAFKFFYGLIACLVAGITGWWLLAGAVLFGVMISIGWGGPIGDGLRGQRVPTPDNYENWQIGILRKDVHLALAVRGLMQGIPILFISVIPALKISIAFAIAFPLAVWLSWKIAMVRKLYVGDWKHQEFLRGFIALLILGVLRWMI